MPLQKGSALITPIAVGRREEKPLICFNIAHSDRVSEIYGSPFSQNDFFSLWLIARVRTSEKQEKFDAEFGSSEYKEVHNQRRMPKNLGILPKTNKPRSPHDINKKSLSVS